jgi:hypothetical protein
MNFQDQCLSIPHTKFDPDRPRNMGSADRNLFVILKKDRHWDNFHESEACLTDICKEL